jgi:hypothetical protein
MGSGVRTSPGPPFKSLIPNNLNKVSGRELEHGVQPWVRDLAIRLCGAAIRAFP